jgi:hypothetical protein
LASDNGTGVEAIVIVRSIGSSSQFSDQHDYLSFSHRRYAGRAT